MKYGFLLLLLIAAPAWAQEVPTVTLSGRVTDAKTGTPLAAAHVYLNGSSFVTSTDAEGRFVLPDVPVGQHRLVVTSVGFALWHQPLLLDTQRPAQIHVELTEEVFELGEVEVQAERPRAWRRDLRRFTRMFVGESFNAEETTITNPEVLSFVREDGRFHATASAPLTIENRALGLKLVYTLEEFIEQDDFVWYSGHVRFEDLAPASEREQQRWAANRRNTYLGSRRHFLHALLTGTLSEHGFSVYVVDRVGGGSPDQQRERRNVDTDALLRPAAKAYERQLHLPDDVLLVLYHGRTPGSQAFLSQVNAASQGEHTWLRINPDKAHTSILLNVTGRLYDPYALFEYGHWSRNRLADLLPWDYQPDA